MKQIINLDDTSGYQKHQCTSRKEGHQLIFECPHCNYTRIYNRSNGKWTTSGGDRYTLHEGLHIPVGINPAMMNAN